MGVPRPGSYFLCNYFSDAHALFNVIIKIENYKIYFNMFLNKSQLVTLNTTLRLHNNDNWHKDEWIDDWSVNRWHSKQWAMHNRHWTTIHSTNWKLTSLFQSLLRRVNSNVCQGHSRVGVHMVGGSNIKIKPEWLVCSIIWLPRIIYKIIKIIQLIIIIILLFCGCIVLEFSN